MREEAGTGALGARRVDVQIPEERCERHTERREEEEEEEEEEGYVHRNVFG